MSRCLRLSMTANGTFWPALVSGNCLLEWIISNVFLEFMLKSQSMADFGEKKKSELGLPSSAKIVRTHHNRQETEQ